MRHNTSCMPRRRQLRILDTLVGHVLLWDVPASLPRHEAAVRLLVLCPPMLFLMLLNSCAVGRDADGYAPNAGVRAAIEAALDEPHPVDAYDALLQVHNRYPNSPLAALSLARVALDLGRPVRARAYLQRAKAHLDPVGGPRSAETELSVAEIRSKLAYVEGRFTAAADYARAALEAGGGERNHLVLARALAQSGEVVSAADAFGAVAHALELEDYGVYATALQASGRVDEALAVLHQRQRRHGYLAGQGAQESMLHTRAARPAHAAAAALMDVEYLRYHNRMPDSDAERNIASALASLDSLDFLAAAGADQKRVTRQLLQGYAAVVGGHWEDAVPSLEQAAATVRHPFVDYLLLVARLRSTAAVKDDRVPEELHHYTELEPFFTTFQPYYYHLWQLLKRLTAGYSILTSRELLEKTILLAPGSSAAAGTRRELGRLLGLSSGEADLLLLGEEIEAVARAILTYRDPRLLDTLLDALSLRETEYTVGVMIALQRLAVIGPLSDYLHEALASADGVLLERLQLVLDADGRTTNR